jgi:hypothetical protein
VKRTAALVLLVALSGCGGAAPKQPPLSAQRDVAQRFARAILDGRTAAAVALLLHPDDEGLSRTAAHAAARWRAHHGTVRLPGRHAGNRWTFGYAGTLTHPDGRFEQVRGDLVVVVAGSARGAAVEFFALLHETRRFASHHDSVLLPSNR